MIFALCTLLAAISVYLVWWLVRPYVQTHALDIIPGPSPKSLLSGSMSEFSHRQGSRFWTHATETYGDVFKIFVYQRRRLLIVSDPKALHSVLIGDQEFFAKRLAPLDITLLLLGPGLVSTRGEQHRRQRKQLNPAFSVAHLRDVTHILYNVAHQVRNAIQRSVPKDDTAKIIDVNGWMTRTTLEMLGQASLGYSFDNFYEDSTDTYAKSVKMFFPVVSSAPFVGTLISTLSYYLPGWLIKALFRISPWLTHREIMRISDTMRKRSEEIIYERKLALKKGGDALLQQVGEGKDIMSISLKANMAASDSEKLTDEELVAQMSTFVLAGTDTTSNALSRILHLLSENPSAQARLRAEIAESQGGPGGNLDIPYDDIMKLPYLDAVCRETFRLYAPVEIILRHALEDFVLPLSAPIRGTDGSTLNEVFIPKDTPVFVHFQASNTSRRLWGEDAYEWKPERWLAPLPEALEDARVPGVYSNLMTFSGGLRSCIGFQFAQLEMKVVLATLLSAFSFELTDTPIVWNSSAIKYPTMGEGSQPEMLLKVKAL
uniref:Cytochrome P450 n=1 Tax=Polyporus umbellatus TaxID=158314 RepID=A0A160HKT2_9APHY|nr:cytochrome P450 [Polyporus umbellatus]